jgi:hypothetical protein
MRYYFNTRLKSHARYQTLTNAEQLQSPEKKRPGRGA